ncbi:hypothetical protein DH2020_040454 [Rehmannia glutinosa]|uniref:Uncharacterized protein n=1 Tax=Rehmannia glutinosa TaxID=99300 RepID=A0ABR0USY2_REHGL
MENGPKKVCTREEMENWLDRKNGETRTKSSQLKFFGTSLLALDVERGSSSEDIPRSGGERGAEIRARERRASASVRRERTAVRPFLPQGFQGLHAAMEVSAGESGQVNGIGAPTMGNWEIASRIGQLYFNQYLRTSEARFLLEAYIFYDAIFHRKYFDGSAKDRGIRFKELRFYARF